MKARIQWAGKTMFLGKFGSGHAVVVDGPSDHGGRNLGVCPVGVVLVGLGGCTDFDMVGILKEAHQPAENCEAFLEAERADEEPRVSTEIHVHFVVKDRGLKEAQVRRTVELSTEKYCSASIMLDRGGVEITHDYGIVELGWDGIRSS